ncbi:MAG: hypothetical protein C0467_19975 [Planctomycetaceae bacterium]|nr:hypothetical protein [Planctomycetaceae bacterium]
MSENKEGRGPERVKATNTRLIDDHEMKVRLVEAALTELAKKYPHRRWHALDCEMIAKGLACDAVKLRMPLTGADVEIAVRALDLAGTILIEERRGKTCYQFSKNRGGPHAILPRKAAHRSEEVEAERRERGKKKSPWNGWKMWSWEQFKRAIKRTIAGAKDGPALQNAVDGHIAKVNAIFCRLNVAYDRKESEIKATEFDPQRQQRRLDRLLVKLYGIKRDITRKADCILIRMLRRASAE